MREYKVTASDLWIFIASTVFACFIICFAFLGLIPTVLSFVYAVGISIVLTALAVFSCRVGDWAEKRREQDAKKG